MKETHVKRIGILAGEASGDLLGAKLIQCFTRNVRICKLKG